MIREITDQLCTSKKGEKNFSKTLYKTKNIKTLEEKTSFLNSKTKILLYKTFNVLASE